MTETLSTSSQSMLQQQSFGVDQELSCPESQFLVDQTKYGSRMARINVKGIDQSLIPVQTNLHRLIQNKLKRKKILIGSSGVSEGDYEDGKKKNKIEEQDISSIANNHDPQNVGQPDEIDNNEIENLENKLIRKPPLPPKPEKTTQPAGKPPSVLRLKRKVPDQNASVVQKLNAQADNLRLEVSELKTALANEKNSLRALRAQNEAETRKLKMNIKKLQVALELSKKVAAGNGVRSKKGLKENGNALDFGVCSSPAEFGRMSHEILALKEANRVLEEKIQIYAEACRRKTSDNHELKDSYEIRLTQISKSGKTEINRLLEEIKSKERVIGQLKKENNSLKNKRDNKNNSRNAQHPPEMKKLKDIEQTNSNNNSNQKCINATCGRSKFNSMPHEITERIFKSHNELNLFETKDSPSSDTDSAVSSAPQSISPQPPANGVDAGDIWHSVKDFSKDLENLRKVNDLVQEENENLKAELKSTKDQIFDLEKAALVLEGHHNDKVQQFVARIKNLEQREDKLIKEFHELKEQNELLEFRILELEESHDKWSLRSNSTPDTRDMWTDTEREHDDILIFTERSDSGITSPHSHHHMDDSNIASPYDLSLLDQISNDEIKRRVLAMTKRSFIEEEDKLCLLQVLNLINNLETWSHDSLLVSEDISLEFAKSKTSDYRTSTVSPRNSQTDIQPLQKTKRIVATVLPYSSSLSTPTDSPRRLRSWNSTSLQESGVFEGDLSDSFYSQGTQTDPDDFPVTETPATGDLCAEIQKLNKFREKIEEVVTKQATKAPVPTILSPNLSDQKRLQYYKDRLELLENKILIYESSGDLQTKRLSQRLQREIHLEALTKNLQQKVQDLESDNLRLEEEKCEFEEAENDTRLRLQRLEVDLEILNQRNIELEMSREATQNKLKEVKSHCTSLKQSHALSQKKIDEIQEKREELKSTINMINVSMPALVLFGALMVHGGNDEFPICPCCDNANKAEKRPLHQLPRSSDINYQSSEYEDIRECEYNRSDKQILPIGEKDQIMSPFLGRNPSTTGDKNGFESERQNYALQTQVNHLMDREKELSQRICELNRTYQETIDNAVMSWTQKEKAYEERLCEAEGIEQCLKLKICQLEKRLNNEDTWAQERVSQLEENEAILKRKICCLNKQNKELVVERESLLGDHQCSKDEMGKLKRFIDGCQENLERERKKVREMEEDIIGINKVMSDMEDSHTRELQILRNQVTRISKELENAEVTNSELKEEVCTLENQIRELHRKVNWDEEKINCLIDEIKTKEEQIMKSYMEVENETRLSLAQEMGSVAAGDTTGKFVNFGEVQDLHTATRKLSEALSNIADCTNCTPGTENLQYMANDVKVCSENMIKAMGEQVSVLKEPSNGGSGKDSDHNDDNDDNDDNNGGGGSDLKQGNAGSKQQKDSAGHTSANEKTQEIKDNHSGSSSKLHGHGEDATPQQEISSKGDEEPLRIKKNSENVPQGEISVGLVLVPPIIAKNVNLQELKLGLNTAYDLNKVFSEHPLFLPSTTKKRKLRKPGYYSGPMKYLSRCKSYGLQSDIFKKNNDLLCDYYSPRTEINSNPLIPPDSSTPNISQGNNVQQFVNPSGDLFTNQSCENLTFYPCDNECNIDVKESRILHENELTEKSNTITIDTVNCKTKKPNSLRLLVNSIHSSVPYSGKMEAIETNLKYLYKKNKQFKRNVKLIQYINDGVELKSRDDILRAFHCIDSVHDMYKPLDVPVLKNLREKAAKMLVTLKKSDSKTEIMCPVYYPEMRP